MSIIIKSDQLNIIIYRYLQQSYTLFNQANLEQSLLQYKFDVKAGHLVSLIQKALIFGQIQSHITINDYEECKEGFYLLKPHVCKITQKVKEEKEALLQQLNEKVFATMRRTSSVYNTLQPNKEFEQIIYEQRSANFFDRVPLKLADSNQVALKVSRGQSTIQKLFCAYESETMTMTIMGKKDNFLNTIAILPCRGPIKTFEIIDDILILIYDNNQCQILQVQSEGFKDEIIVFKIQLSSQCKQLKINKKVKNLITFQGDLEFSVINIKTKKQLVRGKGIFEWIDYFSYLVWVPQQKIIKKYSLKPDQKDQIQQFQCPVNQPNKIRISNSQIYFSVQSLSENMVLIYNFDQSQPLYIFNFSQIDEEMTEAESCEELHSAIWVTANSTDNIILVTDISIKTFEIELNNFSKIIQISNYDKSIKHAEYLKKSDEQSYLICLGMQNIIFYDVSLGKIERVQFSEDIQPHSLIKLDEDQFVGVVAEDRVCILQKSDIQPLFA